MATMAEPNTLDLYQHCHAKNISKLPWFGSSNDSLRALNPCIYEENIKHIPEYNYFPYLWHCKNSEPCGTFLSNLNGYTFRGEQLYHFCFTSLVNSSMKQILSFKQTHFKRTTSSWDRNRMSHRLFFFFFFF